MSPLRLWMHGPKGRTPGRTQAEVLGLLDRAIEQEGEEDD